MTNGESPASTADTGHQALLLDNKSHGRVVDELRRSLNDESKMAVLTGLFSIYGYAELRDELRKISTLRLLLGNAETVKIDSLAGNRDETSLRNKLDLQRVASECADWVKRKVDVQQLHGSTIAQNIFHIANEHSAPTAISGSSDFTAAGLGSVPSRSFAMNTVTHDPAATEQLLSWFDTIWSDPTAVREAKAELLEALDQLARDKPASQIYFATLFNIFRDFLEDIDEESIIRSKTGFKDTIVWNKLYKFQRDGVLGAIDKLERYGGCIIADSVGLGKTFEALAVIKYYELRNDRVLVLAPKKLRENWTVYTVNDKRNLLAKDRFSYDVLNHTDLSRLAGRSGEINLETLNWGNYDLVVIDESHNFRNNNPRVDGVTRYQRLMEDVIKSGVKTKVLMLSATPVNNRLNDLKNQVAFITEGRDKAFEDAGIASIEVTLRRAQAQFNDWLKLPEETRTSERLLETLNFGYFKLLDLLTIARSRQHIEKYYDVTEIGKFPERLKPQNIKSDIDMAGSFPALKEINRSIKKLSLAAYAPLDYVLIDKQEEYSRKYDQQVAGGKSTLKQVDRERSLIHLMRVNMLKRMESSIHSFALTVGKVHGQVVDFLKKIDEHEASEVEELSIEDIQVDAADLDDLMIGRKVKVLIQDLDLFRMRQDLEADRILLEFLLEEARKVTADEDAKLDRLKSLILEKSQSPINEGNKKLIVFTAFSDTAEYLYQHINAWALQACGLHSALVTGGSGNKKCTLAGISRDLNGILTNFSPVSKERDKIDPDATDEIDILIATDCISEGQNLQDCDTLINFDIHWNPVRIIQRFGRVDRLGSKNDAIQLINFWPNMELDEYINLEARVSGRMVLLDISATGEENVIDYDEKKQMNDLEYRRRQMQQLQDTVLDLEDMDGNVSITDLTLNDFRMDLSGYLKEHLEELERTPAGLHAVVSASATEAVPGVIFCLRDQTSTAHANEGYALAPYFLAYVAETGDIVFNHLQAKKSLDLLKKLGATATELDQAVIETLNSSTKNLRNMQPYKDLLAIAVESIVGKTEEKGVESLFARGGTTLSASGGAGSGDFEVVSFLIIKAAA
ncbi:helicase-related protein [Antarctobacter sp.]|uniref:helicase-related protein n=1 Tax=Antarctobacter sp. TaxID=1872577 RepID=UPI002B269990|nr:helicase-related protein [Antarctobacter sp.]